MGKNMSHVGYSASSPIARRQNGPYNPRLALVATESRQVEIVIFAAMLASVVFAVIWVS